MDKVERMEFLLERMKDGVDFESIGGKKGKYFFSRLKNLWILTSNNDGKENMSLNDLLEYDFLLPKHTFTKDELVIMKHLPYPYLVRSEDGHIRNYEKSPMKYTDEKGWFHTGKELYFVWLDHLFPTIEFENKEPVDRKDYL